MILLSKYVIIYFFALLPWPQAETETFTIEVHIENLKSNEGQVLVGLYDQESTFLKDTYRGELGSITNQTSHVRFTNVPKGTYAVSYVHDENRNGKMDTNFMGIPKEGYGCSNNAKGIMGPPKWKDAKFELESSITITIN